MTYELHCGDCLDVMVGLESKSIELIVTSPPYNLGINYGDSVNDRRKDYAEWMGDCLSEFARLLIDGGRLCLNVPAHTSRTIGGFEVHDLPRMARTLGMERRATHIWFKPNHVGGTAWGSYLSPSCPTALPNHEYIYVFDKGYKRTDRRGTGDMSKEEFVQFVKTVWSFSPAIKINSKGQNTVGHNAPFPEALPYRCIKLHSWPGDTVLDPFMGTGTTGKVCADLGRKFVGIEIDEYSFEIAKQRIYKTTNPLQPALIETIESSLMNTEQSC